MRVRLRGGRRRPIVAKTKKDKQQDRKIARIQRAINQNEIKSISFSSTADSAYIQGTNAAAQGLITSMALGTGQGQRIGSKVTVLAFHVEYSAYDFSNVHNYARFVLFKNKGDYNAAIPGLDFLQNYSVTNGAYHNIESPFARALVRMKQLPDTKGNPYVILNDVKFHIAPMLTQTTTGTAPPATAVFITDLVTPASPQSFRHYARWIKPRPFVTSWDSADNPGAGQVSLMVFPGRDTTAAANPFIRYSVIVYYKDN